MVRQQQQNDVGIRFLFAQAAARRYTLLFLTLVLLFSVAAVVLYWQKYFPLTPLVFGVGTLLLFLGALFRPGYVFLFLVAALPFEVVALSPTFIPFTLRPYQWLLAVLLGALLVRYGDLKQRLVHFHWGVGEIFCLLLLVGAGISSVFSTHPSASWKATIILGTLVVLTLGFRFFVRNVESGRYLVPYVLVPLILSALTAIIENILFEAGNPVSVMPGRPNALLPEPDWLGGYLAVGTALLLTLLFRSYVLHLRRSALWYSAGLLLVLVAIVLTVSRSAWLALFLMFGCFAVIAVFIFRRAGEAKAGWQLAAVPYLVSIMAVALVALTGLSRFSLWDRAVSSFTGEQTITLACTPEQTIPDFVSLLTLPAGCVHINLEDEATYEAQGMVIITPKRSDPNADTRVALYQTALSELQVHPFLGSGLGANARIFGEDRTGTTYNASNLFLDLWLGTGLLGLASFLALWVYLGFAVFREIVFRRESSRFFPGLFLLLGWLVLSVFNMLNTMLLLALLFAYIGFALVFLARGDYPNDSGPGSEPVSPRV